MKTILITGASSGLGRALYETAFKQGHRVIGTVRQDKARAELENLAPGRASAHVLDVTDGAAIPRVVAEIESAGPIDVLVNNAGYGVEGPLEEASMKEVRHQFEVNVFGAIAMTRAVLPGMRKRRAGHILNITSMGGFVAFPGVSLYCGSKFALEGISEALGKELKPLGIHVIAVEPGMFRTDFAGRSLTRVERSIPDYDAVFAPLRETRKQRDGQQAGDPIKAAEAMLKILDVPNPPAHLLLGPDAYKFVTGKLDELRAEFDTWKDLTHSTDFAS
jgi:short-subunit dehydrogenase